MIAISTKCKDIARGMLLKKMLISVLKTMLLKETLSMSVTIMTSISLVVKLKIVLPTTGAKKR